MTVRTVTVRLRMQINELLAGSEKSKREIKDIREEVERLNAEGSRLTKGGLITSLAMIPGLAAPAGAALAALPAVAVSGAAALGVLALATHGVGDAMKSVAEGDADKFAESMKGLSAEAQQFVLAYEQIKPTLDELRQGTQAALFAPLSRSLQQLTTAYLPMLLRQMPLVASAFGTSGAELANWASKPEIVAQVGRQFKLAADLAREFGGLLRSGTALLLDMADAGADFSKWSARGLAASTDGIRRWLETARGTGQLNDLFENGKRILHELGVVAGEAGTVLFDVMANPALSQGTKTFLDIVGLLLQAVHGLLGAFALLPEGVQSTVAVTVAVGAALLILGGRVLALKAAFDGMKASALQAGTAVKGVGAFMGGPWGIALTTATVLIGAFASAQAKAQAMTEGLVGTLDDETGAITEATRRQVANNLEKSGALELAKKLKINTDDLTTAVLGGSEAARQFYERQVELNGGFAKAPGEFSPFITKVGEAADAVDGAQGSFHRVQDAIGETGSATNATTVAIQAQEKAVKSLGATLRAQADPAFALIKAQKDLASAQVAYTTAVQKHGATSKEAEAAALSLAQQSVELADAVSKAGGAFSGALTPQMEAAMRAAGLTTEQINLIKKAMTDAKAAGDAFAKGYTATVSTPGLQGAVDDILELRRLLGSLPGRVVITVEESRHRAGERSNRWGGVYTHAATGVLREARTYSATSPGRYMIAEPQTGGEAFVPRKGDYSRSMSILDHAAGWYGASVVPGRGAWQSGMSGTQTVVHEHHHHVVLDGTGVLRNLREEIDLRGGDTQRTLGSRRG